MKSENKGSQRSKASRPAPFGVPSLISGDMAIEGTIRSEGEVQFDGELKGDIHAKGIVIGDGAAVVGEVVAEKVKVAGTIKGKIRATRVELTASAKVDGDVLHAALMIEAGARFDGTCRHSDDPLGRKDSDKDDVKNVPLEREAKLREATGAAPRKDDSPKGEPAPVEPIRQAGGAKGGLR
ncbi:MAG: polymer-forming cytoskeletal protein [Parvularculaceae bacterium]|nr:polymer-forming cytoskeletal protein [Parvularculaceae bacterium]